MIVEGKTEKQFVEDVLAPSLVGHDIAIYAKMLGLPRHPGGNVKWQRLSRDIHHSLLEDKGLHVTTLFDYFRMGSDFPFKDTSAGSGLSQKKNRVEEAMAAGIEALNLPFSASRRFIPYVQMHEFEGLLFSDPTSLASVVGESHREALEKIRGSFETP